MENPHGLAITVYPASFQDAGLGWVRFHGLKTRGFETMPFQGRGLTKRRAFNLRINHLLKPMI